MEYVYNIFLFSEFNKLKDIINNNQVLSKLDYITLVVNPRISILRALLRISICIIFYYILKNI
jgi:hypothetical protein